MAKEKAKLLVVVAARRTFEDSVLPHLAAVFGTGVKDLWDARTRDDVAIKIAGERDFLPFTWAGPVLVVYPDAKRLSEVGEIGGVTAEVIVPWTETSAISNWKATWSPASIGAAQPAAAKTFSFDRVTKVALRSLKALINVNNGMYDREKRDTVEILGTLVAFGQPLDALAVRAWLSTEGGWPGDMADAAMDILSDLKGGKTFRGYKYPDRMRYDRWVAMAEEKT